jgi:hypothetical protein
MGKMHFP